MSTPTDTSARDQLVRDLPLLAAANAGHPLLALGHHALEAGDDQVVASVAAQVHARLPTLAVALGVVLDGFLGYARSCPTTSMVVVDVASSGPLTAPGPGSPTIVRQGVFALPDFGLQPGHIRLMTVSKMHLDRVSSLAQAGARPLASLASNMGGVPFDFGSLVHAAAARCRSGGWAW